MMIFKDREDAAKKLLSAIKKDSLIRKIANNLVIISLLRGGVIFGKILALGLTSPHRPLAVTKISAPYNPELAVGALCFDMVYLEERVVRSLQLNKRDIAHQILAAKEKFKDYCKRFRIKEAQFSEIRSKTAVIVDDGVATGATFKAAALFIKGQGAKKVIIASPVGPKEFDSRGFDKTIILHRASSFSAVSQFYAHFPQVEDEDVKKALSE